MKKSPLSTPGCHTGNFHHQNRGGRGYGHRQSRNNSNNDHFQRFPRSNNPPNIQFENDQVIPLDSSSPVFYHKRGNRRPIFDRRNQRFSNTGVSSSNDNQRNFHNNPDSPYQRNRNQFRQRNEPHWHRRLPINEIIDLKSIFENPWAELEKDISYIQQSDSITNIDNIATEITCQRNEQGDTLSESNSEEHSIDVDNSQEEQKDESSIDLQLDGISFNNDSKNASI